MHRDNGSNLGVELGDRTAKATPPGSNLREMLSCWFIEYQNPVFQYYVEQSLRTGKQLSFSFS